MSCRLDRSYGVWVGAGLLGRSSAPAFTDVLAERRTVVITTPSVERLHGAALRRCLHDAAVPFEVAVLPLREATKTIDAVAAVADLAHTRNLGRLDALIAFGGGVCCDVVTVAAGLFRRGIPYFCIPTTLIGQVDAGVGLKGAVNFCGHKNSMGVFNPPLGVAVDPELLRTLPKRHLRGGLAEILKMALVRSEPLFDLLEVHGRRLIASAFASPSDAADEVIEHSIALMLAELRDNPYEDRGLQRLVDFGHTFSPQLEEASDFELSHGESVSIDIALSCAIAVELNRLDANVLRRVVAVFVDLGLTVDADWATIDVLLDGVSAAIAHRGGKLNLVIPSAIGRAEFVIEPEAINRRLLEAALRRLRAVLQDERVHGERQLLAGGAP